MKNEGGVSSTAKKGGGDNGESEAKKKTTNKPHFRPVADDTKPTLQDPILRSDPIETEEAVLRLPPIPSNPSKISDTEFSAVLRTWTECQHRLRCQTRRFAKYKTLEIAL